MSEPHINVKAVAVDEEGDERSLFFQRVPRSQAWPLANSLEKGLNHRAREAVEVRLRRSI